MLIRLFMLVLPTVLLVAGYFVVGKNLICALVAAAATHLCLASLSAMAMVGRSDPTALCGLALSAALAGPLLAGPENEWSHRRTVAQQVLLGASSAVVFLTSWRFFPTIGAIHLIILTRQVAHAAYSRWRIFLSSVCMSVAGFALVWVPTLLFELHGDLHLYYRRFFGFFSAKSGWGLFPGAKFHLFPPEITRDSRGLLLLMVALVVLSLYRLRQERAEFVAWLLLLPAGWGVYAYIFYKNQSGGGPYYFFPVILLAWLLILRALRPRGPARPLVQLTLVCLIACVVPWRGLLAQQRQLADVRAQTRTFLQAVAARTGGQPVFSEDLHLFKTQYPGDRVDTGDSVAAVAASGYFGERFSRTFAAYKEGLHTHPPRFVMAGLLDRVTVSGVITEELRQVLKDHYEIAVEGPQCLVANGGWQVALFERP
jgi:hypothetical protein